MNGVKKPENRIWNPSCECLPRKDLDAFQYQIEVSRVGALDELEVRVEVTEGLFFDEMPSSRR